MNLVRARNQHEDEGREKEEEEGGGGHIREFFICELELCDTFSRAVNGYVRMFFRGKVVVLTKSGSAGKFF